MTTHKRLFTQITPDLKIFIRWLFVCALLLPLNVFSNTLDKEINNTDSFIKIVDSVPEGFEDLAGPQINHIDVYYQGRFLLSTEATFDYT